MEELTDVLASLGEDLDEDQVITRALWFLPP